MRTNINKCEIHGYVYESKLERKITGATSKAPGTEYIGGDLSIATDEEGMNVITVHYSYVTEKTKQGQVNRTYKALAQIIDAGDTGTWLGAGKENAIKVKADTSAALNDYIREDERVSIRRLEGGFVTIVTNVTPKATFDMDIVLTRFKRIEADPEKGRMKDTLTIGGGAFNFRNDVLPMEFLVEDDGGIEYFENAGISNSEPMYTRIKGQIVNRTVKQEKILEGAFGNPMVDSQERRMSAWVVSWAAQIPYEFDNENTMTKEDLTKCMQNREVHWAEIKKRDEEYRASVKPAAAPTAPKTSGFTF